MYIHAIPYLVLFSAISRLQARLNTVDRSILREPIAHTLRTEIENFRLVRSPADGARRDTEKTSV